MRAYLCVTAVALLAVVGCSSSTAVDPSTSSSAGASAGSTAGSTAATAASSESSTSAAGGSAADPPAASSSTDALTGELTIFAAASLKGAFDELAVEFHAVHPGVTVKPVTYDGSSTLATQLVGGASADIFASADDKNMTTVIDAGLAPAVPPHFASNTLQIAVAPGNPKKITGLSDLTAVGLLLVLCDDAVPCGSAAQKVFVAAGLTAAPVSKEQNVKAVLTKVESGEADAGLVYRTDVSAAAGKVAGIDFPEAAKAVNNYPITVLTGAANPAAAAAFADLVTSEAGQQVLAGLGFAPPVS